MHANEDRHSGNCTSHMAYGQRERKRDTQRENIAKMKRREKPLKTIILIAKKQLKYNSVRLVLYAVVGVLLLLHVLRLVLLAVNVALTRCNLSNDLKRSYKCRLSLSISYN